VIAGILLVAVVPPILPSILPPSICSSTCPDPDDLAHGIALFGVAVLILGVVLEIVRRRENRTDLDRDMNPP